MATLIRVAAIGLSATIYVISAVAQNTPAPTPEIWTTPDVGSLPEDDHGRQVRRGRDLITATYAHIGPDVANASNRYAGNNLACTNCHLQAGTRKFALPLFGVFWDFPQYSARSGGDISIEERVNSCMTRSMNGRPMPVDSQQILAIAAYIRFLATSVPPGQHLPGLGAGKMQELDRAADPARGMQTYARACVACHNTDGSGVLRSRAVPSLGYMIPPLWGADSFNDGAGMARLSNLANFVHFNMPHGADYLNPQISTEEAWDVAAYVESQSRPQKSGLDRDFPDLLEKPVDTPYGPYADGFSEGQHKYGPFAPIRAEITRLKAEKATQPKLYAPR
jgi:thiosulfate dehydrogenase